MLECGHFECFYLFLIKSDLACPFYSALSMIPTRTAQKLLSVFVDAISSGAMDVIIFLQVWPVEPDLYYAVKKMTQSSILQSATRQRCKPRTYCICN